MIRVGTTIPTIMFTALVTDHLFILPSIRRKLVINRYQFGFCFLFYVFFFFCELITDITPKNSNMNNYITVDLSINICKSI